MGRRITSFHFGSFTLEVDEWLDDDSEGFDVQADVEATPLVVTDDFAPMSVSVETAESPVSSEGHKMLVREWTDRLASFQQELNSTQHCVTCGTRVIAFASSGSMQLSHQGTMTHPSSAYDHSPKLSVQGQEKYDAITTAYGRLRELGAVPTDFRAS